MTLLITLLIIISFSHIVESFYRPRLKFTHEHFYDDVNKSSPELKLCCYLWIYVPREHNKFHHPNTESKRRISIKLF
jgi:HD superfamily phosphohydrolase